GDYGELNWSGESYTTSLYCSWQLRRWRLRFGFSLGCSSLRRRCRRPEFWKVVGVREHCRERFSSQRISHSWLFQASSQGGPWCCSYKRPMADQSTL
ncbi:hypothetical protein L1887_06379, partial [Cichorium endivia]